MRHLLSLLLVALATNLACSGIYTEAQARSALSALGPQPPEAELARIAQDFPYTATAVAARTQLLQSWISTQRKPEAQPFDDALFSRLRDSFTQQPPFAAPAGAAVLGFLLLGMAFLLPGARWRFITFCCLCTSALLLIPGFLQPGFQAELVGRDLPMVRELLPQFPRIALGTLIAAAVLLNLPRAPVAPAA